MLEFKVQLTKWLPREELKSIERQHKKGQYVVRERIFREKAHKKALAKEITLYAVFIKNRRNRERSKPRLSENIIIDMPFDDFLITFLRKKLDGIGLLKTVLMTKII